MSLTPVGGTARPPPAGCRGRGAFRRIHMHRGRDELDPDVDGPPINSTRSVMTPYGEQDENGTDLSLIRANLRLPPAERLLKSYYGSRGILQLVEYGRRHRENSAPAGR